MITKLRELRVDLSFGLVGSDGVEQTGHSQRGIPERIQLRYFAANRLAQIVHGRYMGCGAPLEEEPVGPKFVLTKEKIADLREFLACVESDMAEAGI